MASPCALGFWRYPLSQKQLARELGKPNGFILLAEYSTLAGWGFHIRVRSLFPATRKRSQTQRGFHSGKGEEKGKYCILLSNNG